MAMPGLSIATGERSERRGSIALVLLVAAALIAAAAGLMVVGRNQAGAYVIILLTLLGVVLWLSFRDGDPGDPDAYYTLANYAGLLGDAFIWRVLGNTLGFSIAESVVSREPISTTNITGLLNWTLGSSLRSASGNEVRSCLGSSRPADRRCSASPAGCWVSGPAAGL